MKTPALLFCSHYSGRLGFEARLAAAAKDAFGCRSVSLVHGSDMVRTAVELGFDRVVDVAYFADHPPLDNDLVVGELAEFERNSFGRSLREDILQDRWLKGRFSMEWSLRYLVGVKRKVEVLLEEEAVIGGVGEVNYAAFRLVRQMLGVRDIPYLMLAWARAYDRFYFDPSMYGEHRRCVALYQQYCVQPIPQQVWSEADRAIRHITELRKGPNYQEAALRNVQKHSVFARLVKIARRLSAQPRSADGFPAARSSKDFSISSALGRRVANTNAHRTYARVVTGVPSKPYALYLMQTAPEYQITTCGWPYRDEIFLIERIAEALPIQMTLVIKEHQFMLGRRSNAAYERLTKLENVVFVSATANARDLMAEASVVFTISGNGAVEALALGVPAIAFSPLFYTHFEGIVRCHDLLNLPIVVREAMEKGGAPRERVLAAFAAMYSASRPGIPYNPNFEWMKPENLKLVESGFVEELAELIPSRLLKTSSSRNRSV
jgi:hypothetical protein